MTLKKILLIIVVADLVLGTIAYFVVFYNTPGTYEVATSPLSGTPIPTSTVASPSSSTASSTASSSLPITTSTAGTPTGNPSQATYGTEYGVPYPITWTEGNASIAIMGATLQGDQLTFHLAVAMGDTTQCVPMNMRMLIDEQGDLATPITTQFTFPESGNCQGAPGATYTDQEVTFTVNTTSLPFIFTTGGSSNVFFEVVPTSDGGLNVNIPQTNGQ